MKDNCEKCGSDKIIPQAKVIRDGAIRVVTDENPEAFMFKKRAYSEVSAKVCGNCGFIELYADEPQVLYSASQNQKPNLKLIK